MDDLGVCFTYRRDKDQFLLHKWNEVNKLKKEKIEIEFSSEMFPEERQELNEAPDVYSWHWRELKHACICLAIDYRVSILFQFLVEIVRFHASIELERSVGSFEEYIVCNKEQ